MSDTLWTRIRRWLPGGGPVPEVDAPTLAAKLDGEAPPTLIDVRTEAEYRQRRIAGAVHVPIQDLPDRLPELGLTPGDEIVVLCLSAIRSVPAVRLLRDRGHGRAVQLRGGLKAWSGAGYPTESG